MSTVPNSAADDTETRTPPVRPFILSGGSGTRLWPLSRRLYPKQFIPLTGDGEASLFEEVLARVAGIDFLTAPSVVCSEGHRFLVREQAGRAAVALAAVVVEPEGRNTAASAVLAALEAQSGGGGGEEATNDAVVVLLPSDHLIGDLPKFREALETAVETARAGHICTFGIAPTSPHTGYGYIQTGAAIGEGAFHVDRFLEKPDLAQAEALLAAGGTLWNSGMFVFRADIFLAEAETHCPDVVAACRAALAGAERLGGEILLDAVRFAECPKMSIDVAVMEKTGKAAVVQADFDWSDVGSWEQLFELGEKDNNNNVIKGDVTTLDVQNSYIDTRDIAVAAIGVKDLVVVANDDMILVTQRSESQRVKELVDRMAAAGRQEVDVHSKVYRPWGTYKVVDEGPCFKCKEIEVYPGARLSAQMHHRRAEHWVVVTGTAKVERGEEAFSLAENESTYIPIGTRHRLENPGPGPLIMIEVQTGTYLGEDDIVRFDDDYARRE